MRRRDVQLRTDVRQRNHVRLLGDAAGKCVLSCVVETCWILCCFLHHKVSALNAAGCDGNVTMETGANGTIASPHHPCPYPNNATCTWTFIVPNGTQRKSKSHGLSCLPKGKFCQFSWADRSHQVICSHFSFLVDSVVQLVFEEFELERAGRTKGCEKDFVQIGVRRLTSFQLKLCSTCSGPLRLMSI